MKAILVFVTACFAALSLTACDKGAKPEVKTETTVEQPATNTAAPATESTTTTTTNH